MPLEFFRDILDEHFAEHDVQMQLDTALNWGRYAEIFTYDPETDTLRLHTSAVTHDATQETTQSAKKNKKNTQKSASSR